MTKQLPKSKLGLALREFHVHVLDSLLVFMRKTERDAVPKSLQNELQNLREIQFGCVGRLLSDSVNEVIKFQLEISSTRDFFSGGDTSFSLLS